MQEKGVAEAHGYDRGYAVGYKRGYADGIEEGKKRALKMLRRAADDFSHNPEPNSYTAAEERFRAKLP